jgi:hypothetical protein
MEKLVKETKELCGQEISIDKIKYIRKMLNPKIINKRIFSILRETAV